MVRINHSLASIASLASLNRRPRAIKRRISESRPCVFGALASGGKYLRLSRSTEDLIGEIDLSRRSVAGDGIHGTQKLSSFAASKYASAQWWAKGVPVGCPNKMLMDTLGRPW